MAERLWFLMALGAFPGMVLVFVDVGFVAHKVGRCVVSHTRSSIVRIIAEVKPYSLIIRVR